MQTHARIKLKLGTQNGPIKMNLHTNFSANLLKISDVMTNCSRNNIDLLSRLQGKPL